MQTGLTATTKHCHFGEEKVAPERAVCLLAPKRASFFCWLLKEPVFLLAPKRAGFFVGS